MLYVVYHFIALLTSLSLQDFINQVTGHSQPHTFKVFIEDGKAKIVFKELANDMVITHWQKWSLIGFDSRKQQFLFECQIETVFTPSFDHYVK